MFMGVHSEPNTTKIMGSAPGHGAEENRSKQTHGELKGVQKACQSTEKSSGKRMALGSVPAHSRGHLSR